MAKIATLTYILSIDEIKATMLDYIKTIEPFALIKLADEIKTGALFQACAWLSSGGIHEWRRLPPEHCIKSLYLNIMDLVNGFLVGSAGSRLEGSCWSISIDDLAMANAVFAYGLADNILGQTHGLQETIDQYGDDVVLFSPVQIITSQDQGVFRFRINLSNRELLKTPGV